MIKSFTFALLLTAAIGSALAADPPVNSNVRNDPYCVRSDAGWGTQFGANNQYATLMQDIASNTVLTLPANAQFCTCPTVTITKPIKINFNGATLRNGCPNGSAYAPQIDVKQGAGAVEVYGGSIDGRADVGAFTPGTYFGSNAVGLSSAVLEEDHVYWHDMSGQAGFDNCVYVGAVNGSNVAITSRPQWFQIHNVETNNCGYGIHATGYQQGAGIDVGSGAFGTLSMTIDRQSFQSFIIDKGAGATGNNWSDMNAFYTRSDTAHFGVNQSPALYLGGKGNTLSNVNIVASTDLAVWADIGPNVVNGLYIQGPQQSCIWIRGSFNFNGVECQDPGSVATGTVPGIKLDSSAGNIDVVLNGLHFYTPVSSPSHAIVGTAGGFNAYGYADAFGQTPYPNGNATLQAGFTAKSN